MRLSFVVPAFGEAENLQNLLPRLLATPLAAPEDEVEVVVVDDHSPDATFAVVAALAREDPRVKGVRLARNAGSHMAVLCGLRSATGDAAVVMAADGQDPPEFARRLVEEWRKGFKVVWAVRERHEGQSASGRVFSRLYYSLMNRWSNVRLPPAGADFFLVDRRVIEVLTRIPERNTSLLALVSWLGFPQAEVPYVKLARARGVSKWTMRRRLRLVADSIFGFSVTPLKLAASLGFVHAFAGFLYAAALIVNKLSGGLLFGPGAVQGWSALMVVLLISSGSVMLILGVIGEYLWRTLDEVRGRPRYVVEETVNLGDLERQDLAR